MALINTWFFQKKNVLWHVLADATGNRFLVVSVRPYRDKNGKLPNGFFLTLQIINDSFKYGFDKQGNPRESNQYRTFDVTILNENLVVKKGDLVELVGFDDEHSYAINFDLILRFKDAKVLPKKA